MMTPRQHKLLIAIGTLLLASFGLTNRLAAQGNVLQQPDRFVSVGVLRSHGATPSGTQRYALFDEQGSIAAYVTAKRDMDLTPYLNQEIGVTARAVSFGSGKTPFILAERVTRLDESKPSRVQQASFDSILIPGLAEDIPAGAPIPDAAPLATFAEVPEAVVSSGVGSCPACGHQCETQSSGCVACPCGPPHRVWIRPEYLLWWTKGMEIPPLITTSNMMGQGAGALGVPGTAILYGNQDILDGARSGFRIRSGLWLDPCQWWGVEGEWFFLADKSEQFAVASDQNGVPLLARPFFNVNPIDENLVFNGPAREDAQLIALQGREAGDLRVDSETSLSSFGLRARLNLACENYQCAVGSSRVDALVGYRYLRLRDSVDFNHVCFDLNPPQGVNTIQELIFDVFRTRNEFHGPEVGLLWETHRRRWYLELLTKVALGNNRQTVQIAGGTTRIINGIVTPQLPGGLLAQTTNIGTFQRDQFSVIPELGATLGYHLTPRLMATLGYSFIYWTPVVRAGNQIDLDVNQALIPPPANPLTGAPRPRVLFEETDFWAHGLNVGIDFRW